MKKYKLKQNMTCDQEFSLSEDGTLPNIFFEEVKEERIEGDTPCRNCRQWGRRMNVEAICEDCQPKQEPESQEEADCCYKNPDCPTCPKKPQEKEECKDCKKPGKYKDDLCTSCCFKGCEYYCPYTREITKDSTCSSEDMMHNHQMIPKPQSKQKPSKWIKKRAERLIDECYRCNTILRCSPTEQATLDFLDEYLKY